MNSTILVLYYSRGGRTAALARHAARGVESAGAIARIRTVPPVSPTTTASEPPVPKDGPPYAELADLGGQESTLLSMTLPLLHHGMLIVGVPYTEAALFDTRTGGSPYGATHLATAWNTALSKDEIAVAHALGARVARIALRLRAPR